MNKKYVVELTEEEREQLRSLTSRGTTRVRRYKRAQALLGADAGETDVAIAARVGLHHVTIESLRKRFVEEGLNASTAALRKVMLSAAKHLCRLALAVASST